MPFHPYRLIAARDSVRLFGCQMPLPTARSPSIVSPSVKTDTSSRPSTAISLGALTPFTDPFAALNLLSSLSKGSLAADGRLRPGSVALTGGDGASNALVVKEPISLRFDRLVSAVKVEGTPKTIMQSVSGTFQAGRFAAVMGPSGAGKVCVALCVGASCLVQSRLIPLLELCRPLCFAFSWANSR